MSVKPLGYPRCIISGNAWMNKFFLCLYSTLMIIINNFLIVAQDIKMSVSYKYRMNAAQLLLKCFR